MKPDRLNAFTDGVIAIIITIMVLGLPVPRAAGMAALKPELTLFGAYALSFIKVGILLVPASSSAAGFETHRRPGYAGKPVLPVLAEPDPFRGALGRRGGHHARHGARVRRAHAAVRDCRWRFCALPCSPPTMRTRQSPSWRRAGARGKSRSQPILSPSPSRSSGRWSQSPFISRSRRCGWCPTGVSSNWSTESEARPPQRLYRRRARRRHHDHGAGAKIPGRAEHPGGRGHPAAARGVFAELRQHRDLLEQPSPYDATPRSG